MKPTNIDINFVMFNQERRIFIAGIPEREFIVLLYIVPLSKIKSFVLLLDILTMHKFQRNQWNKTWYHTSVIKLGTLIITQKED